MRRTAALSLLLCLLSAGMLQGRTANEPPKGTPPSPPMALRAELGLLREALKADLVFAGTVVEVGKSPGFWCGYFATAQRVTFRVEEVLKGTDDFKGIEKGKEIAVHYFLLQGSAYCAEGAKLRADVFAKGSRHLVMAHRPSFGVVAGPEEKVRLVTELCRPIADDAKPDK